MSLQLRALLGKMSQWPWIIIFYAINLGAVLLFWALWCTDPERGAIGFLPVTAGKITLLVLYALVVTVLTIPLEFDLPVRRSYTLLVYANWITMLVSSACTKNKTHILTFALLVCLMAIKWYKSNEATQTVSSAKPADIDEFIDGLYESHTPEELRFFLTHPQQIQQQVCQRLLTDGHITYHEAGRHMPPEPEASQLGV